MSSPVPISFFGTNSRLDFSHLPPSRHFVGHACLWLNDEQMQAFPSLGDFPPRKLFLTLVRDEGTVEPEAIKTSKKEKGT